ncbi:MAG: hypothetical protein HY706_01310 [Candidatus Hydrogenedentes bacterium]|nr:hypothetical protein [Candidatus Hydrogenedentota bacterium]
MNKIPGIAPSALLAVVLLALISACSKPIGIRLTLKSGEARSFKLSESGSFLGAEFETRYSKVQHLTLRVKEVSAEGEGTMSATYEMFDMKRDSPASQIGPDEFKKIPPAVEKALRSIQGESFTFRLDTQGHVSDVAEIDAIVSKAFERLEVPPLTGSAKPDLKAASFKMLKALYNRTAVQRELDDVLSVYPETPVRLGGSWNREMQIFDELEPIKLERKYTLKSVEGDTITLDVSGTASLGDFSTHLKRMREALGALPPDEEDQ